MHKWSKTDLDQIVQICADISVNPHKFKHLAIIAIEDDNTNVVMGSALDTDQLILVGVLEKLKHMILYKELEMDEMITNFEREEDNDESE